MHDSLALVLRANCGCRVARDGLRPRLPIGKYRIRKSNKSSTDESGITPCISSSSNTKRNPNPLPTNTRFGFLLFGTVRWDQTETKAASISEKRSSKDTVIMIKYDLSKLFDYFRPASASSRQSGEAACGRKCRACCKCSCCDTSLCFPWYRW